MDCTMPMGTLTVSLIWHDSMTESKETEKLLGIHVAILDLMWQTWIVPHKLRFMHWVL